MAVARRASRDDQLAWGRRFRVLNIIDDVTKERLASVVDTSLSGRRVVRELEAPIARRGKPGVIVSDNGAEFTSTAVLEFTQDHKLDRRYIAPGKPTQNAFAATLLPQRASTLRHLKSSAAMPVALGLGARDSQPAIPVAAG